MHKKIGKTNPIFLNDFNARPFPQHLNEANFPAPPPATAPAKPTAVGRPGNSFRIRFTGRNPAFMTSTCKKSDETKSAALGRSRMVPGRGCAGIGPGRRACGGRVARVSATYAEFSRMSSKFLLYRKNNICVSGGEVVSRPKRTALPVTEPPTQADRSAPMPTAEILRHRSEGRRIVICGRPLPPRHGRA